MNLRSSTLQLKLPKPHEAQQTIIGGARRFNVVCCGRRWGKTVLGMDRIFYPALKGQPVAWFSPTYRMTTDTWREMTHVLKPAIHSSNVQERRIELITGGNLDFWSLDAGDTVRGRKYAAVTIDEAAMVPNLQEAWQEAIRPCLTDLQGSAWFLSTPRGINYFKTLYDYGQDPTRSDWASWQMPTSANTYIPIGEIEAARQDLTERAFAQEYLAQFVSWEGAVFRRVLEAATAPGDVERVEGHEYVIGADWGRTHDYTVFIVLDATIHSMVDMDRSNQVDYAVQRQRLWALCQKWRPVLIIAEQNAMGQPIIEQLWREGLPVRGFVTTNASKADAIESLQLALETAQLQLLNEPVLLGELQAFQAERLPSGLIRYSAPAGHHDDCVMALALAWYPLVQAQRRPVEKIVYFNADTGEYQDEPWEGVCISPY